MSWAPLFRGNQLRMAFLRFRLAHIIVAVLRSTALRRVVDGSPDHHRYRTGTSSSLLPGVNTVRPHPFGLRALRVGTGAPTDCSKRSSAAPLVRRGQKTVPRIFAREVDRPFHIIAGTGSFQSDTSGPGPSGTPRRQYGVDTPNRVRGECRESAGART